MFVVYFHHILKLQFHVNSLNLPGKGPDATIDLLRNVEAAHCEVFFRDEIPYLKNMVSNFFLLMFCAELATFVYDFISIQICLSRDLLFFVGQHRNIHQREKDNRQKGAEAFE